MHGKGVFALKGIAEGETVIEYIGEIISAQDAEDRHHIGLCINFNYYYNYVNYRRCHVAYNHYYGRRCNYYERQYPNRSFAYRNQGIANRYELDRTRPTRNVAYPDTRDALAGTRDVNNPRGNSNVRGNDNVRPTNEGNVRGNWTNAATPRPVRQDYSNSTTNSPRPIRQDYSTTTESPRPIRQDYTSSSTNSPRPIRQDYSVTTETPNQGKLRIPKSTARETEHRVS